MLPVDEHEPDEAPADSDEDDGLSDVDASLDELELCAGIAGAVGGKDAQLDDEMWDGARVDEFELGIEVPLLERPGGPS